MRHLLRSTAFVVILLLWFVLPTTAQEYGTLIGVVYDSAYNEPIAYASVHLENTNFSVMANREGIYRIDSISPGQYTLLAEAIAYLPYRIPGINIVAGAETVQDVGLEQKPLEIGPHVVRIPPPDLHSATGVTHMLIADDIFQLPTRGYTEPTGLMTGASQPYGSNNLHDAGVSIRSGYTDETRYYVDGIEQRDPATGAPLTFIGNNTIRELRLANAAFDARYGHVTGGVVDVQMAPPTPDWHGTIEAVTDNFHGDAYDYNVYGATLSGPLWPTGRDLYLAAALERGWSGDATPRATAGGILPHNSSGVWNWQGKTTWKPTPEIRLTAGTMGSELDAKLFSQPFYFNTEHAPRLTQKNYSARAGFLYTPAPHTRYSIHVDWSSTGRKVGDGVYFDDLRAYSRPDGNYTLDDTRLFYSGDDPNTPSAADHAIHTDPGHGYGYITVTDSMGIARDVVVRDERGFVRDGRYREDVDAALASGGNPWAGELIVANEYGAVYADEGWVYENYQKRKTSSKGLRLDFSHSWHWRHELAGGFEYQYHTLRYYHHYFPHETYRDSVVGGEWYRNGGYLNVDHYGYDAFGDESDTLSEGTEARHPYNYSLHIQDKYTSGNLVAFAGLRYDVYHPNAQRLRWLRTPLGDPSDGIGEDRELDPTDLVDAEAQSCLSPRLGIAYALDQKLVLHFSLGRFVQQPNLGELYSGWDFLEYRLTSMGYYVPLGNAGLEPERAMVYELGLSHTLSPSAAVSLTGFYKDKDHQVFLDYFAITPGAAGREYDMYTNGDNSTVQGLEFQLDLHDDRWFAAQVNLTLLDAEGTDARSPVRPNYCWTCRKIPAPMVPHPLEREYNVSALLSAQTERKEGPHLGGFYPFANLGLGLVFRAGSGLPYSPTEIHNEVTQVNLLPVPAGEVNSARAPWVYQLDLKFRKDMPLGRWSGRQQPKMTVYLEVINLFDRKNALDVYRSTGEPDNCGWLDTETGREWLNNDPGPDWSGLDRVEKFHLKENDPLNYNTPRQIRVGMRVNF